MINKVKLSSSLLLALLFLILFSPSHNQVIKIIIILGLSLTSIAYSIKNKTFIRKEILFWLIIYLISNIFFLSIGSIKNPNVFIQLGPLKVLWPILYFISIIMLMSVKKVVINWNKFFFCVSIVIPLFLILTFYIDNLPSVITSFFSYTKTFYAGFTDYFSPAITSLFFLGSYCLTRVLSDKKSKIFLVPVFLILWCSFIIGRRALILLILVSPFLYLFILIVLKKVRGKQLSKILFVLAIMCVLAIGVLSFGSENLRIIQIFSNNEVFENNYRITQFHSLIYAWQDSPIFGAGFGSNAEIVRSTEVLGAYELSYVALLFQSGLIGVFLYISLYAWMIIKLIKIYDKTEDSFFISFAVASINIFIANFSNPYIDSFDGLWFIFLGLSLINKYYIEKEVINEHINYNGDL